MGRPHNERWVEHPPFRRRFMPGRGRPRGKVILHIDEYESIRLADFLGLKHKEAAERMGISRSTFTRLIGEAHRKIGEAVTQGKEIQIKGGNIRYQKDIIICESCGFSAVFRFNSNQKEVCPRCGQNMSHQIKKNNVTREDE